ncbi:right-handed parallel beta-helix repeat-containing protein [Paenibacillus aurantiacus]|uniref:Right-handed parallel beta-helix repeat-containing protein n=1 Tax=Paenibacillus aurantiacus TaxID=1936118 RepID=A0ABV5L022_9BACL
MKNRDKTMTRREALGVMGTVGAGLLASTIFPGTSLFAAEAPATTTSNFIDITQYLTSNQTSATVAIQTAIDNIAENGTVYIPPGTYELERVETRYTNAGGNGRSWHALKITKPLTILLEGSLVITTGVVTGTGTDGKAISTLYGAFWIEGAKDVVIKGSGQIYGTTKPTAEMNVHTAQCGVLIKASTNCRVENLSMKNLSQGVNIFESASCKVINVKAEEIRGCGIISSRSNNNLISSCVVKNAGDGQISLWGDTKGYSNTVELCRISEEVVPNRQGITVENERDSTVRNNNATGFYYAIDIKNGSERCLIENNEVTNSRYGIAIRKGDGGTNGMNPSKKITITKNTVKDLPVWTSEKPVFGIFGQVGIGSGHIISENTTEARRMTYKDVMITGNMTLDVGEADGNTEIFGNVFYTR